MIGVTDTDDFRTSTSIALGPKFWKRCVFDHSLEARFLTKDGGQTDLAPLTAVGVAPLLSVSLASGIGSLRPVYEAWKAGNLTKGMLADIPGISSCSTFFSASASQDFSLLSSPCSSLCSLWKVTSVQTSSDSLQVSSTCPPIPSHPSFRSTSTRSRSPTRLQRPLVHLRPRRDVSSLVTGASPGSLSARCVGLTVSLSLITFSPLSFNN